MPLVIGAACWHEYCQNPLLAAHGRHLFRDSGVTVAFTLVSRLQRRLEVAARCVVDTGAGLLVDVHACDVDREVKAVVLQNLDVARACQWLRR
jgi:hypothetical protein